MRTPAVLAALLLLASPARADNASDIYRSMGLADKQVITGTVLTGKVFPGGDDREIAAVVTHFTGKKDEADAVNVRLGIYRRDGERLVALYERDLGKEAGGYVGRGDLQLVDLDGDGGNEIVLSWDDVRDPLIQVRKAEVIAPEGGGGFRTVWSGPVAYDATRAARGVPPERRDRYTRDIDIPATRRTRGVTLFLTRTTLAVAGERLPEPQTSVETVPFRPPPPE